MRIRITRQDPARINWVSVAPLTVGAVYDIKDATAAFMIAMGFAERCLGVGDLEPPGSGTRIGIETIRMVTEAIASMTLLLWQALAV